MGKRRVYVIDGDPAVRDSLATLMGLDDCEVTTYASARGFLEDLDAQAIDCVVCEAELPDRSGLELFQALGGQVPRPRFALLMSRKDLKLQAEAKRLGIDHVFIKPLVYRNLVAFITSPAGKKAGEEAS